MKRVCCIFIFCTRVLPDRIVSELLLSEARNYPAAGIESGKEEGCWLTYWAGGLVAGINMPHLRKVAQVSTRTYP